MVHLRLSVLFTCGLSTKTVPFVSVSQLLHVSAQFLQTNEMFAASVGLFVQTRKDVGTSSPFYIFNLFQINIKNFVSHILLVLKEGFK